MVPAEAASIIPTCAVPVITGAPVAWRSSSMMVRVWRVPTARFPVPNAASMRTVSSPSDSVSSTAVTVAVTDEAPLPTPAGRVRDFGLMV